MTDASNGTMKIAASAERSTILGRESFTPKYPKNSP